MTEQRPSTTQPESVPNDADPEVAAAAREGNPTEGTGANPWPASELADNEDPDSGG